MIGEMDDATSIHPYKESTAELETLTRDESVHTSREGKGRNRNNDDNGDKQKTKGANDDGDEHKDETANEDEHKDEETCEVRTKLVADEDTRTPNGTKFRWRKMSRKQIFIMMAINFTYLLSRLNYSLRAPLFPKEANEKGVNATTTGWIFGVFALVQFIVSPFYRRLILICGGKSLLMLGIFLCGSCTIGFGLLTFIDTTNGTVLYVVTCFAMQILLAVSCTLIDNTGLVMLVQYFPENVATLMGVGEIFTGIGYVSGPALGVLLYTNGGYIAPFAIAGGTALLALPLYWKLVPKENVAPNVEDTDQSLPILKLLLHPVSVINSVVLIVTAIAWSVLDPTLEPHLRQHEVSPETIGLMFLVMAAFYSITSPIWGRIADLIKEKRIFNVTGMFLSTLAFFWIGPSPVLRFSSQYNYVWYTAIAVGTIGAAGGMCVIATFNIYIIVLRAIGFPENNKSYGMVSGLWVSVYSLGWFIGPSLGGFLLDQIGFEWLVTCTAVTCLITCLLVCVSLLAERKCSYTLFSTCLHNR